MKVHDRIVDGGTLNGSDIVEEDPSRIITTRLLVPNSQVGCLLGKGGKIIAQMREESKTQIRILPRDQAPFCSMPSDEIVQVILKSMLSLNFMMTKHIICMLKKRLRDIAAYAGNYVFIGFSWLKWNCGEKASHMHVPKVLRILLHMFTFTLCLLF